MDAGQARCSLPKLVGQRPRTFDLPARGRFKRVVTAASESASVSGAPPMRRRARVHRGDWPWLILAGIVALAVLAPVAGLVYFAARGSGALWPHLLANVLPVSLRTTAVLLIGVA